MALINYPSVARITELRLTRANPGDVTHEIPSTGRTQMLRFAQGTWHGTVTFGALDNRDDGARMEAFFASLDGGANSVRLPLINIKKQCDNTIRALLKPDSVGCYYRTSKGLVIITSAESSGAGTWWPPYQFPVNEPFTAATHITVKERGGAPVMPHVPGLMGPWTWQFQEDPFTS